MKHSIIMCQNGSYFRLVCGLNTTKKQFDTILDSAYIFGVTAFYSDDRDHWEHTWGANIPIEWNDIETFSTH